MRGSRQGSGPEAWVQGVWARVGWATLGALGAPGLRQSHQRAEGGPGMDKGVPNLHPAPGQHVPPWLVLPGARATCVKHTGWTGCSSSRGQGKDTQSLCPCAGAQRSCSAWRLPMPAALVLTARTHSLTMHC